MENLTIEPTFEIALIHVCNSVLISRDAGVRVLTVDLACGHQFCDGFRDRGVVVEGGWLLFHKDELRWACIADERSVMEYFYERVS
jgi:hypothetical protein